MRRRDNYGTLFLAFALGAFIPQIGVSDNMATDGLTTPAQLSRPIRSASSADLAQFVPLGPVPPSVPLCAHWFASFFPSPLNGEVPSHGIISGHVGERTYLHKASPELCNRSDDDGCGQSAYLLAEDTVNVGFICGGWTYVEFDSRKGQQKGWVETSRLKDLVEGVPPDEVPEAVRAPLTLPPSNDPLTQAVMNKDLTNEARILDGGESPDGQDKSGYPLAVAVRTGNVAAAKLLLSRGAAVRPRLCERRNADYTIGSAQPWMTKQLEGDKDLFSLMVAAGTDINCRYGEWLQTPLMWASNTDRVSLWNRWTADRRSKVLLSEEADRISRLLRAGADPNVQDASGRTALSQTIMHNNVDIALILLQGGANPNLKTGDSTQEGVSFGAQWGTTALMEAYNWFELTLDPTLMTMLLDHGADPNIRNSSEYDAGCDETTTGKCTFQGQTVLTRAAEDGDYGSVRLLLEHGANPRAVRQDGKTPHQIATEKRHRRVAELIGKYELRR